MLSQFNDKQFAKGQFRAEWIMKVSAGLFLIAKDVTMLLAVVYEDIAFYIFHYSVNVDFCSTVLFFQTPASPA